MELLVAIFLSIGAFTAGILGNLIASDLYDRSSRLANWLVRYAATRLPTEHRDRYQEEWLAYISDCEGNVSKLKQAIGLVIGTKRMPAHDDKRGRRVNPKFEAEFVKLVESLSEALGSDERAQVMSLSVEFGAAEASYLQEIADSYGCSIGVAAGALVALGLNHRDHFQFEKKLRKYPSHQHCGDEILDPHPNKPEQRDL